MGRVVKMITVEIIPGCVRQDKPAKLDDWYKNVAKPIESGLDTLDIGYERTKLEWRFKKPIKLSTARSLHCGIGAFIASHVNLSPLDESLWSVKETEPKTVGEVIDDITKPAPVESPDGPCLIRALLYELMRDHIPPGVIEGIVSRQEEYAGEAFVYSNKHLARYAMELAERLKG